MVFRQTFIVSSLALSAILVIAGIAWPGVNWVWLIVGPLLVLGVHDLMQKRNPP